MESFNNKLKYKIKMAKDVPDEFHSQFIIEHLFFETFKDVVFEKIMELIKVNN